MEIVHVLAPNPGPMTGPGTNTWLVTDQGRAMVIDPGPVIPSHIEAVVSAAAGHDVVAVAVTHTHPDHAPAAAMVAGALGAPTAGFAPGPEFVPDLVLADGTTIQVGDTTLQAVHTPGHTADHCCFWADGVLFSGDHIMSGSTVIIEDAAAYQSSLLAVLALRPRVIYPGHGPVIEDGAAAIEAYLAHRRERESQIVQAVAAGARTVGEVVDRVYAGLDPVLRPAAVHQAIVQLRKLAAEGRVALGPETGEATPVAPGATA